MVHLFRGRGFARPPMMGPRHNRPRGFEPDFLPPYGLPPYGNFINRPPMRPRPMPPPRMLHPPPPPRPCLPPHIPLRDMPFPHIHGPVGVPHPIPSGPPMGRPIRPQSPLRGRGMFHKRGMPLKRLVTSNGFRVNKNQKRKEKTEETFFCETCDRGWKTEEKLQEHIAEHEVCGREGCTFTAHPKVVSIHVQFQHDSGLYKKINTEDVTNWIAERKSRFPTKENVEKKEAQMNEMVQRGERIPTEGKRFQNNPSQRNWRDKRKLTNESSNKSEVCFKKVKENPKPLTLRKTCESRQWRDPDAWRGDLPQFPGTAAFPPDEDCKQGNAEDYISDDEEWTKNDVTVNSVPEKPKLSNILTSLVADYGSDITDEDEENDILPPKVESHTPIVAKVELEKKDIVPNVEDKGFPSKLQEENKTQGEDPDSGPDEYIIEHKDRSNIPVLKGKESKEHVNRQETDVNEKEDKDKDRLKRVNHVKAPMRRHQLSLLEKLLRNEIIHERNVILQCVRYIVKNNFIGCGNTEQYHSDKS